MQFLMQNATDGEAAQEVSLVNGHTMLQSVAVTATDRSHNPPPLPPSPTGFNPSSQSTKILNWLLQSQQPMNKSKIHYLVKYT